jgi:molybdate transport system substrate-binding protein
VRIVAALVLFSVTAACGGEPAGGGITVFAASSLTESFGELGRRFEADRPGSRVAFSFGASSTLVDQVRDGAPVDVIATADEASMQPLALASEVFAYNRLSLVVAEGNPKGIRSLVDLARPDLTVVLCAPEVPCGRLGAQAFDRAGARVTPRSYEANVKAVVSKVALGEADAGVAYVTDVRATADQVDAVDIPPEHNVATGYRIARLPKARNPGRADAFVTFVLSGPGQQTLARYGFEPR